ncbi:MAG: hypothetical protein ACLVBP_16420 [Ruminococcus sp.]
MEYWIKAGLIKLAAEVTKEYGMRGNPSYIRESREKLTENLKNKWKPAIQIKNPGRRDKCIKVAAI